MLNIIFVDDDENLLKSMMRNLRKYSGEWKMEFYSNVHDALNALSKGNFDIIVTDYKMPGMNGLDLLIKVREQSPGIKRILLTGQSESEVYKEANNVVDDYLAKPCNLEDLVAILKKSVP